MDHDHLEDYWYPFAIFAVVLGVGCAGALLRGEWMWAFGTYTAATFFRLVAGSAMNRMGDTESVNAWNNRYHRWVVIALNSVVGAVLLGRLVYDWFARHMHIGPLVFLACAFAAYFIAAKFTRPNTFGARVRSAALTAVLLGFMAALAYYSSYSNAVHSAIQAAIWGCFSFAVYRLRALQRRFGWADR